MYTTINAGIGKYFFYHVFLLTAYKDYGENVGQAWSRCSSKSGAKGFCKEAEM